ncbi:MAG: TolC family protein [Deltaproteobacteria bacterium]|nr:TolC family protein [Deltaproteobacteria bacterium]
MRSLGLVCLLAAPAWADDSAPTPAIADTYAPPDFMKQAPPLPPMIDTATAWRLDLPGALQIALRDNLNIAVERESVVAASLGITVAAGVFEPQVRGSYTHTSSQQPPATAQEGMSGGIVKFDTDDWRLSLSQRLSTGMQLSVDFANDRSKSSAGTAVEPLNYRSSLTATVTQPLLRGFSMDRVIPRIDILRAEIANERERAQLAVTAAQVIEHTEDAYWDVVLALYAYDLQRRSQQRAEEQMALTQRQITAGLLPPGDLTSAESTLASRQLAVVQAELNVEAAWDALRAVLNLPRDQWSKPILPTEAPSFADETVTAEDELKLAITNRPELAQAKLDIDSQTLNVRQADNNRLPEIDLGLSGGLIGQDSTYGGALREYGRADATTWALFLNLTWTPLQRATRAAAEIEREHGKAMMLKRDQALQDIWAAVRDAVRTQTGAARQVFAAAKFRTLSAKNLEIEQRKFLTGQTSNFVIAQRQEELAQAQLAELQAVVAHKKAQAALLRATGRLLDERGVKLH